MAFSITWRQWQQVFIIHRIWWNRDIGIFIPYFTVAKSLSLNYNEYFAIPTFKRIRLKQQQIKKDIIEACFASYMPSVVRWNDHTSEIMSKNPCWCSYQSYLYSYDFCSHFVFWKSNLWFDCLAITIILFTLLCFRHWQNKMYILPDDGKCYTHQIDPNGMFHPCTARKFYHFSVFTFKNFITDLCASQQFC